MWSATILTPFRPSSCFRTRRRFDRNIGWVTEAEQQLLRRKRVAIAGLGGVGARIC